MNLKTLRYEMVDYIRIFRGTVTSHEIYGSDVLTQGIPMGYSFLDFRPPVMGELYIAIGMGHVTICGVAEMAMPRIILRKL